MFATFLGGETRSGMTYRKDARGNKISLLGYGAMRYPTIDGSHANTWHGGSSAPIDVREVQRHIDYAIEHGVNYFDTSPAYCRGESEKILGECLARYPRDSYFLATKMSNFASVQQSFEGSKALFNNSLGLLQTDYIDYYLLHSIGQGGMGAFEKRFVSNGVLDFLIAERKCGKIHNLGFSYHGDVDVLNRLLEMHSTIHWDFVQIQLNYVDWYHAKEVNTRNTNAEWLYEEIAMKRNIPVVVMEPMLGGRLAQFNLGIYRKLVPLNPSATMASWALRFAATHPKVLTVLSGMTRIEHLRENIRTLSPLHPLSSREISILEECAKIFLADKSVPCTSCNYCMPCPYGIDIPGLITFWNEYRNNQDFLKKYDDLFERLRRAERCTGCGICQSHCPQLIDIPNEIAHIDEFIEKLRRLN